MNLPIPTPLVLMICLASMADADGPQPTLADQLKQMAADSAKRLPVEMRKNFSEAIEEVRESGIEKKAKQVGDQAPDGTLMAWDESEVTLSQLWAKQPVVLTWYRGGWCPYCNLQMRAMQQSLAGLEGAGARLVAITPELPENTKQTAEENKLSFLVLHDKQNQLAHEYGIVFDLPNSIAGTYRDRLQLPKVNGYDHLELPLAATYVIDKQGVIRWAFLDADYKNRAEPADVIAAIKKLDKQG